MEEKESVIMGKASAKEKSFWLCYDFGIRGDYQSLFQFLDEHNAIECGAGMAYFTVPIENNSDPDIEEAVILRTKNAIVDRIKTTTGDRLYLIWRQQNSVKGVFLVGNRKDAPWVGYGQKGLAQIAEGEG